jgi:predicted outer membrane repeat protein
MWLTRWLTHDVAQSRRPLSRRRTAFRPRFEVLENRWVLSTVTVLNTLDSGAGSLRAAIAAAHGGDSIAFAIPTTDPGYNPTTGAFTIGLSSGELLISRNITINGPGADKMTISGGKKNFRVFEVANGLKNVVLSGLTIRDGLVQYAGGGILNHGTLTVSTCVVSDNSATGSGGGLFNDYTGTLTVTNCTISRNTAPNDGGGIDSYGVLTVSGSTLDDNYAQNQGGAINNYHGAMTVTSCTLRDNSTDGAGGGIFNVGNATISGSTLSGNRAENGGEGGGIANYFSTSRTGTVAGPLTVSDCTLSGNSAGAGGGIWNFAPTGSLKVIDGCVMSDNSGGGIYVGAGVVTVSGATLSGNTTGTDGAGIDVAPGYYLATVTVSGCTFSGNVASGSGGAIYVTSSGSGSVSITVSGCTLSGNTAASGDGGAIFNNSSGKLTISNSDFSDNFSGNTRDDIFGAWIDGLGNTFA